MELEAWSGLESVRKSERRRHPCDLKEMEMVVSSVVPKEKVKGVGFLSLEN